MKNELRTAVVGFLAVVVGFAGAWFVFGARVTQLATENDTLRQQAGQLIQQIDQARPHPREEKLLGRWATTVEKTRLGRIELVFDLRGDGSVIWQSVREKNQSEIARGKWQLDQDHVHFAVTVTDQRSSELGHERSTVATIKELSKNCLTLIVDGDEWSFRRADAS